MISRQRSGVRAINFTTSFSIEVDGNSHNRCGRFAVLWLRRRLADLPAMSRRRRCDNVVFTSRAHPGDIDYRRNAKTKRFAGTAVRALKRSPTTAKVAVLGLVLAEISGARILERSKWDAVARRLIATTYRCQIAPARAE